MCVYQLILFCDLYVSILGQCFKLVILCLFEVQYSFSKAGIFRFQFRKIISSKNEPHTTEYLRKQNSLVLEEGLSTFLERGYYEF